MHQDLWAPWRMAYLRDLERRQREVGPEIPALADFLQHAWEHPEQDEQAHVIYRNEHGLLMLNRYPYANGHLLASLGVAKPRLHDHAPTERAAFWELVDIGVKLAESCFTPHGVNIGVNQGEAAGAGLPQHLHAHVVPRLQGDFAVSDMVFGLMDGWAPTAAAAGRLPAHVKLPLLADDERKDRTPG